MSEDAGFELGWVQIPPDPRLWSYVPVKWGQNLLRTIQTLGPPVLPEEHGLRFNRHRCDR